MPVQFNREMQSNTSEFMRIGAYFTDSQLKDAKEKLELRHGVKLSISKPEGFTRLLCKDKRCSFFLEYRQVSDAEYIYIRSNQKHTCCQRFSKEEMTFYENRKMIIDRRQMIYNLMKERYPIHGFEKPKKLLSILLEGKKGNELLQRILEVECAEDRRKLKKKFDNIVAEVRTQLCQEDPNIRLKMAQEKRERKRNRKSSKKKLTVGYSSDEEVKAGSRSRSRNKKPEKQEVKVSRTGKTGKGLMFAMCTNTRKMDAWEPFQQPEDLDFLNQHNSQKSYIEEFEIKDEPGQNRLTITKNLVTHKKTKVLSEDEDWTGSENQRRN